MPRHSPIRFAWKSACHTCRALFQWGYSTLVLLLICATAFAAYMMVETGLDYQSDGGATNAYFGDGPLRVSVEADRSPPVALEHPRGLAAGDHAEELPLAGL